MWHEPAAHSDGDIIVFFRKSDVIVAGDIIAADRYPYIDAKNGGSIDGIISGLNRIVGTAVPEYNQQGGTRIVPGHGRIMQSKRRRGIPRHGDDHSRPDCRGDQGRQDARADQGDASDARLRRQLRFDERTVDDGHVHRGDLHGAVREGLITGAAKQPAAR